MNTLQYADTFFFITTIAVIAVAVLVIVVLSYVARVLRNLAALSDSMKGEAANIIDDIATLRQRVKDEGSKVVGFGTKVKALIMGKKIIDAFRSHKKAPRPSSARPTKKMERERVDRSFFERGEDL